MFNNIVKGVAVLALARFAGEPAPAPTHAAPSPLSPADEVARRIHGMTASERQAAIRALARPEQERLYRQTDLDGYLALGRKVAAGLGVYGVRLTKQERVRDKVLGSQVIAATIRETPKAVRLEFVAGPKAGRRILYNEKIKSGEMLVKEPGILGLVSWWIDIGGNKAKGETNHKVTDTGYGPLLSIMQRDVDKVRARGGMVRRDEGFEQNGAWCISFTAPEGVPGLDTQRMRLCLDLVIGLPVKIEVWDKKGFLERHEYSDLRANQPLGDEAFTAKAAGI